MSLVRRKHHKIMTEYERGRKRAKREFQNKWQNICFEITDQDIKEGVVNSVRRCPAAIALNRQYPLKNGGWRVCNSNVYLHDDTVHDDIPYKWIASEELINFQILFDQNKIVRPVKFTMVRGAL